MPIKTQLQIDLSLFAATELAQAGQELEAKIYNTLQWQVRTFVFGLVGFLGGGGLDSWYKAYYDFDIGNISEGKRC